MNRKRTLLLFLFYCFFSTANCQEYAGESPEDDDTAAGVIKTGQPVTVFKATRIINGSSVTSLPDGTLDFRISHRFGRISEGGRNFFGLDDATTKIGLDYGI